MNGYRCVSGGGEGSLHTIETGTNEMNNNLK